MRQLTFQDVLLASESLAKKIRDSNFVPDYLIGIATGGLYPLALLSKELNNKKILTITAKSEMKNDKKVVDIDYFPVVDLSGKCILVIDDITDSGETLREISKLIVDHYHPKSIKTATLGSNMDNSKFLPDYFVLEEKGEWLKFPWEKENFSSYPY